jgi:ATP-binding protein involved in chromosome partitioning
MNDIPRKLIVPKNVTDALRTVKYPGSDEDIVSLEMPQEIRIAGQAYQFFAGFSTQRRSKY